ncbi:MAG TPA: serine/threonine-protein kinase [Steroidobacteraceae bacterium]|jgi:serine/threonine protein kinase|nr:serine/threonine-protein kinase [Steroidobacteraceae bacterium]
MTERVLIMRHASGLVNRARRLAIVQWPTAKLEVHDLAAYGKPPADFRWDRYAHLLIDDEYLRKEGLLWLSELRGKPNFPKIVRVLPEPGRHTPPAEVEVKSPPHVPRKPENKSATKPEPPADSPSIIARADARRLADAEAVLKSAGIQGFTPVKPLGSGATANVCLCERVSDKQQVVLKVLKSEGSGDSDLLSRFVQEYFAASSIDSPYVAKVFEHGFTDSHAYIVMEYFPAGDLRARVARDRPSVEESLIIIGSILSALTSVHAGGIIHRDLKPANVMFRDDGTIALVDFGSARRDADPVAKTLAGVVIGTPYYLSPEQALGGTADERSDLYSVGVMLYELLTGQRMYAAASLVALFEMHKNAPIPRLPENLSRHQRFVDRLVSKKPDERFASAAEAFQALMEYSMNEPETTAAA